MWPRRETGEESREALPLEQEKWQGLSRQGCSIRLRIPLPSILFFKRCRLRLWEVDPSPTGSRGQ